MKKRTKWKNNSNDWDCGIVAMKNLDKVTKTRQKHTPRTVGAKKGKGVTDFNKYKKNIKKTKGVKEVKVLTNPKPKDIIKFMEEDKEYGKTQNVAIIHTKKKLNKKNVEGHLQLAYKADKDGLRIANFEDGRPSTKVTPNKLSNKKIKIKRAYGIKVEKRK